MENTLTIKKFAKESGISERKIRLLVNEKIINFVEPKIGCNKIDKSYIKIAQDYMAKKQNQLSSCANKFHKNEGTVFDRKILDVHVGDNLRLFNTWKITLYKCSSPKHVSYKYYGGKGITVCDEWLTFSNFVDWAHNNGYKDNLTLDRIDGDKNYCPENCRWVTWVEQGRNKCNNKLITINGITHVESEWVELTGIRNISHRVKIGIPNEILFDKKLNINKWLRENNMVKKDPNNYYNLTINNVTKTLREWCIELGYSYQTVAARKKQGISDEELFNFDKRTTNAIGHKGNPAKITINGETHTLKEWSNIIGLDYQTLLQRYRKGIIGEDFLKPVQVARNRHKLRDNIITKTINGETHTLKEWSNISGLKYYALLYRYNHNNIPDELFLLSTEELAEYKKI